MRRRPHHGRQDHRRPLLARTPSRLAQRLRRTVRRARVFGNSTGSVVKFQNSRSGCRITAITPAFQAGDEGSTPFTRSMKIASQAVGPRGFFVFCALVGRSRAPSVAEEFELRSQPQNAVMGGGLDRVLQMRATPEWKAARAMPKGRERTKAFRDTRVRFRLTNTTCW